MYGGIVSDRSEGALGRERWGGAAEVPAVWGFAPGYGGAGVCTHGQGKVGAEPGAGAAGAHPPGGCGGVTPGGRKAGAEGARAHGEGPFGAGWGAAGVPHQKGEPPPDPTTWGPPAWARGSLGEGPAWLPPWRGWGHAPPYLCPYWFCSSLHCFTSFSRLLFSVWAWHSPNNTISLPPWCAAPSPPPPQPPGPVSPRCGRTGRAGRWCRGGSAPAR